MESSRKSFPAALPALLLTLVLLFQAGRAWDAALAAGGVDFYQFWAVGRVAGEPGARDIYTDQARRELGARFLRQAAADPSAVRQWGIAATRQVLATYSTPFLYSVFHLAGTGNYERDYLLFQALSSIGAALSVFFLARRIGLSGPEAGLAVAVLVGAFQPFLWDIRAGNVNRVQLILLCSFLLLRGRRRSGAVDLWSGLLLGAAIAFKPNIVFAALLLLAGWTAAGHWRTLRLFGAGLALALGAAVALSWPFYGGPGTWGAWLEALRTMPEALTPLDLGNYSLPQLLFEGAGRRISLPLTALALAGGGAAVWLSARAGAAGTVAPEESAAGNRPRFLWEAHVTMLGCLVYLISTALVWGHYFLLAFPAVILLLGAEPRPRLWVSCLTAVAAVLVETGTLRSFFKGLSQPAFVVLASAGLSLLFGLLAWRVLATRLPRE